MSVSDKEKQQEKENRIKSNKRKEKENFTLCLIRPKTHLTETYGGLEIQHHELFFVAVYGDVWSATNPNTLPC